MKYYLSSLTYPFRRHALLYSLPGWAVLAICIFFAENTLYRYYTYTIFKRTFSGIITTVFTLSYVLVFWAKMIRTTADGAVNMCTPPLSKNDLGEDWRISALRPLVVLICYALPGIIFICRGEIDLSLFLLLPGALLLPMALMRTCAHEEIKSSDPFECLRCILAMPLAYLGLLTVSLVALFLFSLPFLAYHCRIHPTWASVEMPPPSIYFVLFFGVYSTFLFYISSVYMNILGLFYKRHASILKQTITP